MSHGFQSTESGPLPIDWDSVTVKELAKKFRAGGTPRRSVSEYWGGSVPFVRIGDMTSSDGYLRTTEECISEEGLDASSAWLVPPGTVLLAMYASIGEVAINHIPVATNQAILAIIPKPDYCDARFLFFALKYHGPRLAQWNVQTTQKNVSKGIVSDFPIPLPSLSEQRSIAHVLSCIKEAIEKTESVLDAVHDLRESLMEHLFTYGNVRLGNIEEVELKEERIGDIPEHWSVLPLGDVAEVKGGKRMPKGSNFANTLTPYPYIRVSDFHSGGIDQSELCYLEESDYEIISRYVINKEDVYISIAGTIGLTGTIPEELDGANITENAARIVITNQDELDRDYLANFLGSRSGQESIQLRTVQTSQPKLALTRIKTIPVPLPPIRQQLEITESLARVDSKIAGETSKVESLKSLFQTMLQLLMTGQVRVKDWDLPEVEKKMEAVDA